MNKPAKKPTVVAKTARKVKVTQANLLQAKATGVSIEDIAKDKLPKRGRPVGSKNQKIVMTYDDKPFKVDWEKLAKQLQAALAAEIKDNDSQQHVIDDLAQEINFLCDEINRSRTFFERLVCLFTGKV